MRRPTRRTLVAAATVPAVLVGGFLASTRTRPAARQLDNGDWPACTLSTELSTEKLRAKGHKLTYRRIGARGGLWWMDGHYIGKSSGEDAPFMACSTRRVLAPMENVPRY